MTTGREDEAVRPSQPFQVVQAVCISREPSLKLPKGLRVVGAGVGTFHCPSLRSTPVKWTPRSVLMGKISNGESAAAPRRILTALSPDSAASHRHLVPISPDLPG